MRLRDALKLPLAGRRKYADGITELRDSEGYYWTSTPDGLAERTSYAIVLRSVSPGTWSHYRSYGFSVRCLAD